LAPSLSYLHKLPAPKVLYGVAPLSAEVDLAVTVEDVETREQPALIAASAASPRCTLLRRRRAAGGANSQLAVFAAVANAPGRLSRFKGCCPVPSCLAGMLVAHPRLD
jgi:hypothetical protein